ncbi:hypothetical protein KEM52_004867, partial [Ascosphaera acerosa]
MTGAQAPGAYASFLAGVRAIYAQDGLRGFYRGFVPALFGVSHGALQFVAYERLKGWFSSGAGGQDNAVAASAGSPQALAPPAAQTTRILDNMDYLVASTLSKIFAGGITYPYQVLRSRLQAYDADATYRGVADAVAQIWRKERLAGFYKGLVPNLVRVLPSTCVTFLVYENVK